MSWRVIEVNEQDFHLLKEHNRAITNTYGVLANEGVEVRSSTGKTLNCIFDSEVGIRKINGASPNFPESKNRDLALLNDLLSNPNVNTIILDGFFGTGKTSNVMSHVVDYLKNGKSPKVYMSKPHVPTGKSYGHLPGKLTEKIHHEFRSFYQYIDRFWEKGMAEKLISVNEIDADTGKKKFEGTLLMKELGDITLEALPFEYIRGLDLEEECWVILDETQNTDIQEVSTFVSRLGSNVKLVALGDTSSAQIDRKSVVNPEKNGFAFIKKTYEDKSYSGTVNLRTRNHILRGDRVKHLHDAITRLNQIQGGK